MSYNFLEWCEEGQYVCANARQCIEMSRVCDGTPDCPLGDDEKSCVALADELEDNEVIPYNEEGTFFAFIMEVLANFVEIAEVFVDNFFFLFLQDSLWSEREVFGADYVLKVSKM